MIASVLGGEGTVADTTQKPEKTDVFTPTTDPNAAVSEVPAESVPEEVPARARPAAVIRPEKHRPSPLPTQEEVEQAASSIYNAASSIWGAIQDAASQQNDAA